jgi:hypothetical protein
MPASFRRTSGVFGYFLPLTVVSDENAHDVVLRANVTVVVRTLYCPALNHDRTVSENVHLDFVHVERLEL